jgi:hypothetical protein
MLNAVQEGRRKVRAMILKTGVGMLTTSTGADSVSGGRAGAQTLDRDDRVDRPAKSAGAEPRCRTAAGARAWRAHSAPLRGETPQGTTYVTSEISMERDALRIHAEPLDRGARLLHR